MQKQRAYVHLALRSALKAPLLLPGSYFSAPLAAPSSSGCFCGRGALLETRLPFIALNVPRRSLSSAPPPRTLLLAMAQREGLRLFPTAFLQMVTPCLPAARVPGAPRSRAGGLLPFLCLAGFSAALRRGHGSISPQDTRRQRGLLQSQPCPSASPPSGAPIAAVSCAGAAAGTRVPSIARLVQTRQFPECWWPTELR